MKIKFLSNENLQIVIRENISSTVAEYLTPSLIFVIFLAILTGGYMHTRRKEEDRRRRFEMALRQFKQGENLIDAPGIYRGSRSQAKEEETAC